MENNNYNGILCIYKEKGITSRDVVNSLCKIFNTKKIGHTGTLDPLATGVLVLGINEGTKLIEIITAYDKEYISTIKLGLQTDTLDLEGKVINEIDSRNITKDEIDEVLKKYTCTYNQQVPSYSAVKINGKKLYEYARKDITIELPKREVTIFSLERISEIIHEDKFVEFTIKCNVSKGTYIRSLIRDIGNSLGTCATMTKLERTKQGDFNIDDCYKIEDIQTGNFRLKPIKECISNIKKEIISEKNYNKIKNGALIEKEYKEDVICFMTNDNKVAAIYKTYEKDNTKMKPWKMFKII